MTRRLLVILLTILFLISCFNSIALSIENEYNNSVSQKVKICVNDMDTSLELSLEEAEKVKDRFIEIEKGFEGIEKINEQIQILKELGIFPSDFSTDILLPKLDNYEPDQPSRGIFSLFRFNIGFPLLVSHLTIGGRINYLFHLKPASTKQKYIHLDEPLNGSYLNMTYGFLTTYVGYAFKPVFVTIVGIGLIKNSISPIFPFFEILVPCVGFSIAFNYINNNSILCTLFEYNLDACLFCFIAGF